MSASADIVDLATGARPEGAAGSDRAEARTPQDAAGSAAGAASGSATGVVAGSATDAAPPRDSDPELWDALRDVRDPEVPVSLVDLGLIYAVRRNDGRVEVDLSFTATACPAMDFIQDDIRERLLEEPGVDSVETRVVWDPPWTPDRISDRGREALRRFGISL